MEELLLRIQTMSISELKSLRKNTQVSNADVDFKGQVLDAIDYRLTDKVTAETVEYAEIPKDDSDYED